MTDYYEILNELYSKPRGNIKPGLERTLELSDFLGNPHNSYPTVHIAGTNGKGTTVSAIASILQEAGYRVGLYTSPHILKFNERMRVNSECISDEDLTSIYKTLRPKSESVGATFFEITTVIAFEYFKQKNVDIAVIETGMGGRWDSTNIISPIATGITYIGMDHQEYLGDTIEKIANEKAGIIKPEIPIFTYAEGIAKNVIEKKANEMGSPFYHSTGYLKIEYSKIDTSYNLTSKDFQLQKVKLELHINNAEKNIGLALSIINYFKNSLRYEIRERAIINGLENMSRNTGYTARMAKFMSGNIQVYLDIAHNPDAFESQVNHLLRYENNRKAVYILGIMSDKDIEAGLSSISKIAEYVYLYSPSIYRAAKKEQLLEIANSTLREGSFEYSEKSANELLEIATNKAQSLDAYLVVTGSFHVAEDFLPLLQKSTKKDPIEFN